MGNDHVVIEGRAERAAEISKAILSLIANEDDLGVVAVALADAAASFIASHPDGSREDMKQLFDEALVALIPAALEDINEGSEHGA